MTDIALCREQAVVDESQADAASVAKGVLAPTRTIVPTHHETEARLKWTQLCPGACTARHPGLRARRNWGSGVFASLTRCNESPIY